MLKFFKYFCEIPIIASIRRFWKERGAIKTLTLAAAISILMYSGIYFAGLRLVAKEENLWSSFYMQDKILLGFLAILAGIISLGVVTRGLLGFIDDRRQG